MSLFALAGKLRLAASKLKCAVANLVCNNGICCGGEWHESGTGECCGGQWYPSDEPGDCCGGVWYPAEDPCPAGFVYLRWGPVDNCCGCLPEQIFDPREGDNVNTEDVKDDLCCPVCGLDGSLLPFDNGANFVGCRGACCGHPGGCEDTLAADCESGFQSGVCCESQPCPVLCCWEDSAGTSNCETKTPGECQSLGGVSVLDCETGGLTGCTGYCCVDGEAQGPMSQAACAAAGGQWLGVLALGGSNVCVSGCDCRAPFDCGCCETVTSTAAGLTFTQPKFRRDPPFTDTFRVTASGRTESSIYIHGIPVGASCDFEITFLLCGESFNVEPIPCNTNFKKLNIKVCWSEEHTGGETLNIRGCETGTIAAGSCRPDGCNGSGDCPAGSVCTTTLLHDEAGVETDVAIQVNGRLTIDSSGSGPLVLTGDLTVPATSCSLTIVLTGTNDDLNRLDGDILQNNSLVIVEKRGSGTWGLAGANTHTGQLKVLSGTLVVLADVDGSTGSPSPFGTTSTYSPVVGDAAAMSGVAALLLADDVSVDRTVLVSSQASGSSQVVILGGYGSGASTFNSSFSLPRDVTLQAATGGTVTFNGLWFASGSPKITIGSNGNAGTVVINDTLPDGSLDVVLGTLGANATDIVSHTVPVTVGSTLGAATIDQYGKSLTLDSLTFAGDTGLVTNGTLRPTAVDTDGIGHEIASAVSLNHDATFTVQTASDLTVSGVISGAYAVAKEGGGLLLLSAANTYSGGTTINGGTARAGDVAAFGTGAITVNAGGTLDKAGFALANTITNNGGTVLN